MDTAAVRKLLDERDELDRKIAIAVGGSPEGNGKRKATTCSKCGNEGHTARNCPNGETQIPS